MSAIGATEHGHSDLTHNPEVIGERRFVFPVTFALALQYLPLTVVTGWLFDNPQIWFIIGIVFTAIGVAFAVELLMAKRRRITSESDKPISLLSKKALVFIAGIGSVATFGSALLGAGTYGSQVGTSSASVWASLLTPFTCWSLIGAALALFGYSRGALSRRWLLVMLAMPVLATAGYTLISARTAPLMQFLFALAIGALLARIIRIRTVLVAVLIAIVAWPAIYEIRNAQRFEIGGVAAQLTPDQRGPFDRLREDKFLERAASVGELSVDQPNPLTLVRFGLIPRFVDPDRGELPSGKLLNAALGGSERSSNTFTLLGGIWSLNGGWWGLAFYVGAVTAFLSFVSRKMTGVRLAVSMLSVSALLWIESVYPDNVAGLLQNFVSLAVAMFVVRIVPFGVRKLNMRMAESRPIKRTSDAAPQQARRS